MLFVQYGGTKFVLLFGISTKTLMREVKYGVKELSFCPLYNQWCGQNAADTGYSLGKDVQRLSRPLWVAGKDGFGRKP